jgi:hypothetical protein
VKTATVMVHPRSTTSASRRARCAHATGETFKVEGSVVDWTGKLAPAAIKTVQIEMVLLEADYSYGYDDETASRATTAAARGTEGKATAAVVGGKFTFDVTPGEAYGGYLVRVKAGKARTDLVLDGEYSYDYYDDYGEAALRRDAAPGEADAAQA